MKSQTALAISALTLGAALAVNPSFAQTQQSNGCIRFQTACSDTPYPMPGATNGARSSGASGSMARERNTTQRLSQNRERGMGDTYGFADRDRYYNSETGAEPEPMAGSAIAACEERFRSFDPATGTYMGLDGIRHRCP